MKDKKIRGLILFIIFALAVLMMSCQDESECLGVQQKIEQIKRQGGDNTQWIQNQIIQLQLDNPECL